MVARLKRCMIYTAIYLLITNPAPSYVYAATFATNYIVCDGGEEGQNCQNDIINCIASNTCTVKCNVGDRRRLLHSSPFMQPYAARSRSSSRNLLWSCNSSDGGCCGVTVNCPVNNPCNIDCNYRCHGLTVNAQQASTVSITNCDNCNEMTINCPQNGRGPIDGRNDGRCSLEIENDISALTVYAEESFFDFTVTHSYGSHSISSSVMHCGDFGANVDHSCALNNVASSCSNSGSICVDYRIPTTDPTTDPTADPTTDPTHDPSPAPTLSPSELPSASPTKSPSFNPSQPPTPVPSANPSQSPTTFPSPSPTVDTVHPSPSPTADPTVDPTRDPSVDPTVDPSVDPTTDPTADPTAYPTPSPTLPEGEVGDHHEEDDDLYETGQDELAKGSGSIIIDAWLYIAIASALLLCCILIFLCSLLRRKKKIKAAKNVHFNAQTDAHVAPPHVQKVQSVSQIDSTSTENRKYEGNDNGGTHAISAEDDDMNMFNEDQFGTYLSNNMVASNVLMDDIVQDMCTPNGLDMILNGLPPPPPPQNHNPLIQMAELHAHDMHIEGGGGGSRGRGGGSFVVEDEDDDHLVTAGVDADGIVTVGGPMGGDYDEVDEIDNNVGDECDDIMIITAGGPMEHDEIDYIENGVVVGDDMDGLDVVITVGDGMNDVEGDNTDDEVMGGMQTAMGDEYEYEYEDEYGDEDVRLNDDPLMTIQ